MYEVSPFYFIFFPAVLNSDLPLDIFKGLLEMPDVLLDPERTPPFIDLPLVGEKPFCLGPLSLFWRINFTAYSLE
jgi:hypothetical protein